MNTSINEQKPDSIPGITPSSSLEAELQELEDIYAECLGDDVDAKTLSQLWTKIKAIKVQIALNQ